MKALRYLGPDKVQVMDVAKPAISDGEALVKVRYSGICGSDMAIVSGNHPRAKPPLVPGHEFSGTIAEIKPGSTKTNLKVGDPVTAFPLITCGTCWACRNGASHVCRKLNLIGIDCDGFMAEFARVPIKDLYKLPAGISMTKAAVIEPLAVGIHSVSMAQLKGNESVVVMGAGPIGLVVAIALRQAGVSTLVLTDINATRLALARQLGFDTLNVSGGDGAKQILDRTGGEGADVVFEVAGSADAAMQMAQLARSRGKIILVSVHKKHHEVDLRSVNFKELTILGTRVYTREDFTKAVTLADKLPIDKLVSHTVPLAQAEKGFDLMRNPDGVCKVLIES